jgi:Cobyric acid synthase
MIMGICGGYQMLGRYIHDPYHVESSNDGIQGLGLLNTVTTFAREKQTFQVKACMLGHENLFRVDDEITGYEIHMGETTYNGHNFVRPFARITERAGKRVDILDGCVSVDGNIVGTYIHGVFDNDGFRFQLIQHLRKKKGQIPSYDVPLEFKRIKEQKYNKLAEIVRENIDMNMIYKMVTI